MVDWKFLEKRTSNAMPYAQKYFNEVARIAKDPYQKKLAKIMALMSDRKVAEAVKPHHSPQAKFWVKRIQEILECEPNGSKDKAPAKV